MRLTARAVLVTIGLIISTPAVAHDGSGAAGGFVAGVEHPLTGLDHLLAMVSVGIWGAVLRKPLLVVLPIIFPGMMAVGGLLGIIHLPFPPVEFGIAVSVLMLGGAIASAWRAPIPVAVLLVGVFATFHGYAHGSELPRAADPVYYSIGFMLSTGLLHIAGIGIGSLHDRPGGVVLTRGAGGLVLIAGAWFLWLAVT